MLARNSDWRSLSSSTASIWAKTAYVNGVYSDSASLRLYQHMADTEAIAELLWRDFVPRNVKALLISDVGDEESVRKLFCFLAMTHDVGKASPAFEVQNDRLADEVRKHKLCIDSTLKDDADRSEYRHELVGYKAVLDWFEGMGFDTSEGSFAYAVASIIANHHGTCVDDIKTVLMDPNENWNIERYVGDQTWRDVREELLKWAAESTAAMPVFDRLRHHPLRRRSQLILIGLVVMADWIASNAKLFPLNTCDADLVTYDSDRRARRAWRLLDLPKPWQPVNDGESPDAMFAKRFAIEGASLRPMQRALVELAERADEPELYIVEANMGEGKTEAALLAAEILARKFGCGGIYYALPTQATVNAMFHRVLGWIGNLLQDNPGTLGSVYLAQGKNELNTEFVELRKRFYDDGRSCEGNLTGNDCAGTTADGLVDSESDGNSERVDDARNALQSVVNSWLTGRRRGNLADFVVGTVDQVLMAGLQSKYVVLRHLALAGKVVILDEIHSNTAYMDVYMETVLTWLGAYGVPVIMLSATLPQDKREKYLEAYRSGISSNERHAACKALRAGSDEAAGSAGSEASATQEGAPADIDLRYPRISHVGPSMAASEAIFPDPSGRASTIRLSMAPDDDDATLVTLLADKLQDGGCAVVVRDTVTRAQQTYATLKETFRDRMPVILDHSRFLASDRTQRDAELLERFGKDSTPETRQGIVVATQVVEQSLDVDFDLMISDIAPIDLILQRAGRLHRHHRGDGEQDRPERLRDPELILTGVKTWPTQAPPEFGKGITRVYQEYFLLRTLAQLEVAPDHPVQLSIPHDIPSLIQTVYHTEGDGATICSPAWQEAEDEVHERLKRDIAVSEARASTNRIMDAGCTLSPCSIYEWTANGLEDPDVESLMKRHHPAASVREGEDSFEIIVLQQDRDGNLSLPQWGDFNTDCPLPTGPAAPDDNQARDILSCTIALNRFSLANLDLDAAIAAFECATPDQWYTYMNLNRKLNGQLVLVLDENGNATLPVETTSKSKTATKTMTIHYSVEKGWEAHVE